MSARSSLWSPGRAAPDPFLVAADLFDPPALAGRWYCDISGCDGHPHEGMHWCEHPVDSDEHTWQCRHQRADQRIPPEFQSGKASDLLVMAGRGYGKTRIAAEWIVGQARGVPGSNWAVVAPTLGDIRDTCFEGESGILAALDWEREDERYNKTALRVRLDNGSVIRSYSAETPRKSRGPNLHGAWLEEIAQWVGAKMWENLFPAIRRGLAQTVATTTPAPVPLVLEFVKRKDGSVVIMGGSTFDNAENLAASKVAALKVRWEGTRHARQELYGELLIDVPGALWSPSVIEATRGLLLEDE
ncbi:MAG: terminase large subunit domain-containing protein [Solirubrobacteraceae bacterium]